MEKFIESIFPSQDAGAVASDYRIDLQAQNAVAAKPDKESKKDLCYIMLASAGTMLLITGMMVCLKLATNDKIHRSSCVALLIIC